MRKSLTLMGSLAVGIMAFSAVPTTAQAHWWWYGTGGSGSGTGGSGSGGSTNTSTTAPGFSRTYVSPGGDDANGCSVNDPCRTFTRALARTFVNGEINCTEAGGYGTVVINKSVTIDCKEVPASINAGTANAVGITINIPVSGADPLRVVRLRGFTMSGAGGQTATNATTVTGTGTRVGLRGIHVLNASAVYVEHLVISDFIQQAILDQRTSTPAQMFIIDTVVRNNGGSAIVPFVQGGSTTLDNVRSEGNLNGLAIGPGNNVTATRSVFAGNSVAGVEIDAGGTVFVGNSVMSSNGIGLQITGGATARSSNNDITYNATGVTGQWISYGNNRLGGNTAPGTAPTAAVQQ